jgi:3-oxoadipate enol-lactonase
LPELRTDDATLHVEIEGTGEPVTVFAHGLTNSCMELAAFTPFVPGTKIRFCFRGHGHSSAPSAGSYGFSDLARDVEAVADAYGATCAVGTSMGAGAITHLLGRAPDRFERLVFLLPAALDEPLTSYEAFDRTAELLETLDKGEAIESILAGGEASAYAEAPWLRDFAMLMWQDVNPHGVARAIREVVRDVAIADRELLRKVTAPTLVICRRGDEIHPVELGAVLADLMPNAELVTFASERELFDGIPALLERVNGFLAGAA